MPIADTMMRGATNMRRIIAAHLESKVPTAIDILRLQNSDLDEKSLPYPVAYNSVDPVFADRYPYMGAFVTGADKFGHGMTIEPTGHTRIDPLYEVTLFVATATANLGLTEDNLPKYEKPYRESALRMRDDLMAILVDVVVAWPSLGTARSNYRTKADIDSMRLSFPEPIKKTNEANPVWICTGLMTININMSETTVVPYFGYANVIENDISNVLQ